MSINAALPESQEQILRSLNSGQIGPEAKEYNLMLADEEYENGNIENSIYYQVKAQFQCTDARYINELSACDNSPQLPNSKSILREFNQEERDKYQDLKYLQNITSYLQQQEKKESKQKNAAREPLRNLDFLEGIEEPVKGLSEIVNTCKAMPQEWCVVQLCKGFNTATTYSGFGEIFASDGAIYMALLSHCRSPELPPTCLRIGGKELTQVFQQYSTIVERFRRIIVVDPKTAKTTEGKRQYWKEMSEFEIFLQELIGQLRRIIAPYVFLFYGKRYNTSAIQQPTKFVFQRVDEFCKQQGWNNHQRILLSQAGLHANKLSDVDLKLLSLELSQGDSFETEATYELLKTFAKTWQEIEQKQQLAAKRYPTILIVDERLDHFHWEQLATDQELTRVKSLHSLWRLYKYHKSHIMRGYYTVNISRGLCIINPDGNLPGSGRRLRSFFEYWLSHWQHIFETVPTEQVMKEQAFNADCFVYAGHGSGLQFMPAKAVCRAHVKGVVFLFGCDSTRMLGTGLYSALYGAHNYYHGAQCPTVIGTLMPALDSNMDSVSVSVLSRWVAPGTDNVMPWSHVDRCAWTTAGEIKSNDGATHTLDQHPNYQMGSLCSILARVQQGRVDTKIYNSCVYVCRGLPAWNLAVQKIPLTTTTNLN